MGFKKGNKEGKGRPKGSENKVTADARELFIQTLEGLTPELQSAFEEVRKENPSKFLELFAKYAQYFVPKKTESDVNLKGESIDFNKLIESYKSENK